MVEELDGTRAYRPAARDWTPPRYVQIRERLRRQIAGMQPGDRLPSDAELQEQFSVSRVTARRAIAELVSEGLVERRRGSGTYVHTQPIQQDLYHPAGWTAALRTAGYKPVVVGLKIERRRATAQIAAALALDAGDDVFSITRVLCARDEPISLIVDHVAAALLPDLAEVGLRDDSLTATLQAQGQRAARVDETVEARSANAREASALAVPAGSPVLVVTGVVSDPDGMPLSWSTVVSRGDRHRYSASYTRP